MSVNKNKQAVIVQLKKDRRAGARWCAFKNMARIRTEEIKCFHSYIQAAKFCETENKKSNGVYKICVITDLLNRLQSYPVKGKRRIPTEIAKAMLCKKYPPLSFPLYMEHQPCVPADRYFPVVWYRVVNPLADIPLWRVLLSGNRNTVVFGSKDYCSVLDYFMKRCSEVDMADSREELKLQARIHDASFDRYLELYRFYYHTRRGCYMLGKKIEGTKPFLLPVTYFAKYNQRLKRLEFFDECLKKIVSGKIIGEMNVQYYDTGCY
ncbi:hypothetical protein A9P82_02520 [Arachidicoccus ginsenosidimutans]|uniref:hypothetical protein n=1 Tax=Arachidicoccus sp. BS20 TaxID=1850526 RepID=UPI0007F08D9D|nr:hypothetical protein [Arachidicoccus sp. BS20]ANI88276.1 hypothetical protein A9P82_02520 [Arachidicoccus sp. BS20]